MRVRLVFDRAQFGQLEEMRWFVEQGFDLRLSNGLDGERGVQHNKFAVFDGLLLETGSYNWTQNARENNFENLQFFNEAARVAAYAAYFERIRSQASLPMSADL